MAFFVGDEDGLGGRVGVLEGEVGVGSDLAVGVVELDDLDPVGVLLEEAGDGEAVLLVATDAPVHGVYVPRGLVRVDLRPALLLVGVAVLVRIAARPHRQFLSLSLSRICVQKCYRWVRVNPSQLYQVPVA